MSAWLAAVRALSGIVGLLLLLGCQGPHVFVLHAPVQPSSTQPVTYTAIAEDPDGVEAIEIWEDRNELKACANGRPCAVRLERQSLKQCRFDPPQPTASCSVTTGSGYPDRSLIGYRSTATDARGNTEAEGWIYYAAGAFPWPDQPIPIYATGPPAERLDFVLVPDKELAREPGAFTAEATRLLHEVYLSPKPFAEDIRQGRGRWNFYLTYQPAEVQGPKGGCFRPPAYWPSFRGIMDAGAILHRQHLQDCIGIGEGSLFSLYRGEAANDALAVHQTYHAVFSLADEYCCDGGYWEAYPEPNIFSSRARCRTAAAARDWPLNACRQIGTPTFWHAAGMTGWWRLDPGEDLMASPEQGSAELGPADRARIRWIYEECEGEGC